MANGWGEIVDLGAFYKLLGDVLKQRFKGWTAFVLSGNKELSQSIGLKSSNELRYTTERCLVS